MTTAGPGGEWWEERGQRREETGFPSVAHKMINKDDFNTICENSIQFFFFFFNASFFFKGTKKKKKHQKNAQKLCVVRNWMKATYITLWLKVEIWRHTDTTETLISLCEGWKKKKTHEKFLDDVSAWAELCDNHNNLLLIFLLGFKGVFHIILSHSVYCTSTSAGDECSGDSSCRVVQCVYCDWKDFDNLEKGLCNASIGVCSALYNWIQHRTPHTWDWGWIMHYQWSHLQLLYSGAARDMARK